MSLEPVLLVDDDPEVRASLQEYLDTNGYTVETVGTAEEALLALGRREFPVVVTDLRLSGGQSGLDLAAVLRQRYPDTLCILITGHATLDTSIRALKQGIYDLLQKPFHLTEVGAVLDRALDHARLLRRIAAYREELESRIYARSRELRDFQSEALALCEWTAGAGDAATDLEAVAPFLDRIEARWFPDGLACYRGSGKGLDLLAQRGSRAFPERLEAPMGDAPDLGYREGHGIPLGPSGWLYVGFAERSAFSPADPGFRLVARHLELALRLRYRA